jgi:leader peptidase (prepilin peptidase)/N-methyltransferase
MLTRLARRAPVVAALALPMGVLVLRTLGPTWAGARALVLGLILLAAAVIDVETLRIPDRLTLPGIVLGLATQLSPAAGGILGGVLGCLVGGALLYAMALLGQGGTGGGDIKLAATMGAFLGWPGVLLAVVLAVLAVGLTGGVLLLTGVKGRRDVVPFGPFLALGGIIAALWSPIVR